MKNDFQSYSIAVAEDDDDDYMVIEHLLKQSDSIQEVRRFEDGKAALSFMQSSDNKKKLPDLLILDLNMPAISGYEVLDKIKTNPVYSSMPVIVFSTSKSWFDINIIYSMKANAFVVKPSDLKGFEDSIQNIIQFWLQTAALPDIRIEEE